MSRIESPSSINTFKQCPRRYYYRYIEKLPSKPSIFLIRGKIVHSVLEHFFDIDKDVNTEDALRMHLFLLFEKNWTENRLELEELGLGDIKLKNYYEESKEYLRNWFNRFKKKHQKNLDKGMSFTDSFKKLTPIREEEYNSPTYKVRGFMDAVFETEDHTIILDYKTGKKTTITPEYRLQLGIYALLYEDKKGKYPTFVGIDFLNHTEYLLPVDEKIVEEAKHEIEVIHRRTTTTDIEEYPQKTSPLCKWRTGQCDYYEQCFGNKPL